MATLRFGNVGALERQWSTPDLLQIKSKLRKENCAKRCVLLHRFQGFVGRETDGNVGVLPAGSELTVEAGMTHFEGTRGETVVEISGEGPWAVTFLDPSKDPSGPQTPR